MKDLTPEALLETLNLLKKAYPGRLGPVNILPHMTFVIAIKGLLIQSAVRVILTIPDTDPMQDRGRVGVPGIHVALVQRKTKEVRIKGNTHQSWHINTQLRQTGAQMIDDALQVICAVISGCIIYESKPLLKKAKAKHVHKAKSKPRR